MATLDELADPNYRVKKGPACSVGLLLIDMDDKTAATLVAALANPHAPSTGIVNALRDLGHKVSSFTVQRHRRGDCQCGESE